MAVIYVTMVVQWLRLAPSEGLKGEGASFPSVEDGNRASFRNVVFSNYSDFQTMEKIHKLNDSECYTQSSEP
jgi:hypothetical protein